MAQFDLLFGAYFSQCSLCAEHFLLDNSAGNGLSPEWPLLAWETGPLHTPSVDVSTALRILMTDQFSSLY